MPLGSGWLPASWSGCGWVRVHACGCLPLRGCACVGLASRVPVGFPLRSRASVAVSRVCRRRARSVRRVGH
eukprot:16201631-Heterocapsa_arctica.AAC.1